MKPLLTTITPYWGRSDMLHSWVRALQGSAIEGAVEHILLVVGEPIPDCVARVPWLRCYVCQDVPGNLSIGHYHNLGAELANSEWIMKLDVDTIPNVRFFHELLPMLTGASPREWFNVGMVYLNRWASESFLSPSCLPLLSFTYERVMKEIRNHTVSSYAEPQATNWVCRKQNYLSLGGCDDRFRGYGWEDYQQVYMLEHHARGHDPLPGELTMDSVTRRCRDEIARPRALALWHSNPWLCLFHHHHPPTASNGYRNNMQRNREVLLNFIERTRQSA